VFRLRKTREAAAALLGLAVVVAATLHQQVRHLDAVPDRGDPLFSMWRLAWVRHQIAASPRHLFDANIFYPLAATLTYSDSMILPAVAAAPLAWLHVHPVVAYNLTLLAAFVLSGWAAYGLARALGGGMLAAWITAVSFTIAPFRMNHFSHLELQMTMWMPIVLLSIHRLLLRDGSGRYGGVLAASLAAQWYSSMYYGFFLTFYASAFAAVLIVAHKVRGRRLWQAVAGACVAAIVVFPLVLTYARSTPARGERPPEVVAAFSAVPEDYVRTGTRNPIYRALPRAVHAERALFPGLVVIVLALAGVWPPFSATRAAIVVAGLVAFDGSLGVNGVLYSSLYHFFSPLHSVRAPARFAILVVLTLALLAGHGAARLLSLVADVRLRAVGALLLTAAIVADAWPRYDRLPVWRSPPAIYASLPAARSVLFEFPVHSPADRFSENLPYMYFSMWHWRPMVNGYSGFTPPSYAALLEGTSTFPDPAALQYLARVGVTHIALNCRLWEPDVCASTMSRLDAAAGVRRLARAEWYGAPSTLYELRREP
jgi:hypothetical protein